MPDPSLEELLREQRRRELARLEEEARRRQALVTPRELPTAAAEPVTFAPEDVVEAERRAALEEEARRRVAEPGVFLPRGTSVVEAEREELRKLEAELERRRSRAVQAGREEPTAVAERGLPFFRPTRIREEPGRVIDVEGLSPLRPEFQEQELRRRAVPEAELPAPFDVDVLPLRGVRVYVDPETGERREPTLLEEIGESFALQTVTPEEQFRQEERRRALQQQELDRRYAAGEAVPLTDRIPELTPGSLGILARPEQGAGVVETSAGALLRGALSWMSAAASEAYFAGLGYEVDENGLPRNPDDFAFALKQWKEARGIPDVVAPQSIVQEAVEEYATSAGLTDEQARNLGAFASEIPEAIFGPGAAFYTPGFETTRTVRKASTYDPNGLRVVEDIEVPPLTEDPRGFFEAELRRIAQNVSKGRTIGDEFMDTPAIVENFARTTGDPDNAYWAGMMLELLTPTATDVATVFGKGASAASRAAADAGVGFSSRARATRALQAAEEELQAVRVTGSADDVARLEDRVRALRDAREDYDPTILRNVTERAVRRSVPEEFSDAVIGALRAEAPDTLREALAVVRRTLPADESAVLSARVGRLVERNLPGDFVMVTENIGVPRALEADARAIAAENRRELFVKPVWRIADDLLDATEQSSPAVRSAAIDVYNDLRRFVEASDATRFGYGEIPAALRRRLQTVLRQTDEDVPRFDQARPRDFSASDSALQRELSKFDSWDDVPADLRRQALAVNDVRLAERMTPRARLASDLTRLQTWFPSVVARFGLLDSRLAATPALRRLRASLRGPLETETLASARIGREIDRAGRTALRTLRDRVLQAVERLGSVDRALNDLVRTDLRLAGEGPEKGWRATLGHLYGDANRDKAVALLRENNIVDFNRDYPTIESLKAVDRYLTSSASEYALGRPTLLLPDYQSAMLKTLLEEGVRRLVVTSKQTTEGALRAAALERRLDDLPDDLVQRMDLERAIAFDRAERTLPAYLAGESGPRVAVYDRAASRVERGLAESGDELFKQLESVPVRQRADAAKMARDAYELAVGTGRRNLTSRAKYGFILPNIVTQSARLMQLALVPLVTLGVRDTLAAATRSGQRALNQVIRRRFEGGGIRTPDGLFYSSKTIDRLEDEYGIGVRQLDTERVGTLAADLLRDARKATVGKLPGAVADFANPLDRGFFLRIADALERNFRRSVFEVELARGRPPVEAAERAVESQLDYAAVPDVVASFAARYIGESALLYKLGAVGLEQLARNPGNAARVLKALRLKAETQDPYDVHGDKALKSLGIVNLGDDKTFYLPELPIFRPAEAVLTLLRNADLMVDGARFAAEQARLVGEEATTVESFGELVTRSAADVALPAVFEAFDRFAEGDAYSSSTVPGVEPMSDEKFFWAAAIAAHNNDPDHEPGGSWDQFLRFFAPNQVNPPAGLEHDTIPGVWTAQPPDGTPHILYGYTDSLEPLYYVFEPSERGLRNIRVARSLDVADIERFLPLYIAATRDQTQAERPTRFFTDFPETIPEALLETVAAPTDTNVERERARQAERIRTVRENTSIQ